LAKHAAFACFKTAPKRKKTRRRKKKATKRGASRWRSVGTGGQPEKEGKDGFVLQIQAERGTKKNKTAKAWGKKNGLGTTVVLLPGTF